MNNELSGSCIYQVNHRKNGRKYVCDSCGALVEMIPFIRNVRFRFEGEFQGNYLDASWRGSIPFPLLRQAYDEDLIDCRWMCSAAFGMSPMGAGTGIRRSRSDAWRASRRGRTNSFPTSSYPATGPSSYPATDSSSWRW